VTAPATRGKPADHAAAGSTRLIVHVDGGARGNPGPAAAACVLSSPDGETLEESSRFLGSVTNNVAEYEAVLLGVERAVALGASEIELINDAELIAKQLTGAYAVRHEAMRRLHGQALDALQAFKRWSIRTVPRASNAQADALVNVELDRQRLSAWR
jgi:ribonuclease HI